jgi:hypothetical protein
VHFILASVLIASSPALGQTGTGQSVMRAESKSSSRSESFGSHSMGHLVTPNNNSLKAGTRTVGTMYAGYAPTDNIIVGVSPFAFLGFDMLNAVARATRQLSGRERLGFDLRYYKTYRNRNVEANGTTYEGGFKMEAWTSNLTYNRQLLPWYRANLSAGFNYYIDDERPFSLRMDPSNADPYAANLTSLHEIRLRRGIYLNLEAGSFGLNYTYPYYHLGATVNLQNDTLLVGLGLSTTFSPSFPAEKAKVFAGYDSRASVHPEVQVQAFF